MFGSILQEKDKTSSSGIGIKLETGIDTPGYIKPTITFSDFYSHDLDGLEIQFSCSEKPMISSLFGYLNTKP